MPDPVTVQCPSCQTLLQVPPERVGQPMGCPSCGQPIRPTAAGAVPFAAGSAPPVGYATPDARGGTSGLAVASLVCGILFCLPLCSVLALIFGIIGINQTKPGGRRGRGMAVAGTVLGSIGLFFLVLIPVLLPSLNKARETANRARCASNMRQIGLALSLYQQQNAGQSPPDLTTLWQHEPLSGSVFVCPSSHDTPAAAPAQLTAGGHLSYVYVPPDATAGANTPVLYEPLSDHATDGTNVLFGDNHVAWYTAAAARALITTPGL